MAKVKNIKLQYQKQNNMAKKFQGVKVDILDDNKNKIGAVEVVFTEHKQMKEDYDFKSVKLSAEKLFKEVVKIMAE